MDAGKRTVRTLAMITAAFVVATIALAHSAKTPDLSDVKQSVLAVLMYSGDYDDHAPLAANWMEATAKYPKDDSIFRCQPFKEKAGQYGHAMHASLPGVCLSNLDHAERKVAVLDSTKLQRNATSSVADMPRHGRSMNRNYAAYADGHATSFATEPEPRVRELHPLFMIATTGGISLFGGTIIGLLTVGFLRSRREEIIAEREPPGA
jgi:hypothetical protein